MSETGDDKLKKPSNACFCSYARMEHRIMVGGIEGRGCYGYKRKTAQESFESMVHLNIWIVVVMATQIFTCNEIVWSLKELQKKE
jgi:hypothetical protein